MSAETIADAALAYAKRGWRPVPLGRKSKKPIGKGWQKRPAPRLRGYATST
jgi:hypothetical protein